MRWIILGALLVVGSQVAEASWSELPVLKQSISIVKCVTVSSGELVAIAVIKTKDVGVYVARKANEVVSEGLSVLADCLLHTTGEVTGNDSHEPHLSS